MGKLENAKQSRISDDGKRLVTVFIDEVAVFDLNDNSKVWHIPVKNAADACISPLGTWCATFERLAGEISESNIKFWLLSDNLQVTRKMAFTHKAANTWMPSWTSDEKLMGRMLVNELQSFDVSCPQDENLSTSKPFLRIKADNISSFAFSPDPNQKFVAVFTRNSASTMAAVRVYSLSTPADDFLSKPAVFKVFAKAEKCTLMWSPNGRYLLALAQTEVDASGVSYYGETHLYFLAADGTSDCRVSLDAEGPIHDVAWSPDSDAFVTIYGYMPGRAILFSAPKCQARFTFAVGAKNWVRWNPQGSLLCFAAFGNLPGHVEIWHRPKGSFSGETTGSCKFETY